MKVITERSPGEAALVCGGASAQGGTTPCRSGAHSHSGEMRRGVRQRGRGALFSPPAHVELT